MSSLPTGTPSYRQKRRTVTTRKPILSKLEREFPDFYQSQSANSRPGTASSHPAVALANPPAPSASVASASTSIPVPQSNVLESPPPASTGSWKGSPLYPPSPFQLAMERQKQERDLRRAAKRKSLGDSGSVWSRASSVARSVANDRSIATASREPSQALSRSEFARSSMTRSRDARLEYEEKRKKDWGGRTAMSPQRPIGSMSLYSFGSQISRPTSRQSNNSQLTNTADDLRSILARAKAVREDDANAKRLDDAERRKEAIRMRFEEEERAKRERAMEQYIFESKQQETLTPGWNSQTGEMQGSRIEISDDDENGTAEERQPKRLRSEEGDAYDRMQRSFYEARKDKTSTAIPSAPGTLREATKQVSASPPRKRGNDDDDQGLASANHKRHHGKRADQSFIRGSLSSQDSLERMSFISASASKEINGGTTDKSHLEDLEVFEKPQLRSFSANHGGNGSVTTTQDLYLDLSGASTQFGDGIFSTQPDNTTSTQATELAMDSTSPSNSIFHGPRLKLGDEICAPSKIITFHGTKSRSASAEFAKPAPASPKRPTQNSNAPGEPSSPAYHTRSAERRHSMSTRRSSQLTSSPEMVTSPTTPRIFTNPMVVLDRPPSSSLKSPPATITAETVSIQKTAINAKSKTSILHLEEISQTESAGIIGNGHGSHVPTKLTPDADSSVAINEVISETTYTIQNKAMQPEELVEDVPEQTTPDNEGDDGVKDPRNRLSAVFDSKTAESTSQDGNGEFNAHLRSKHDIVGEKEVGDFEKQGQDTEEPLEESAHDEDAEGSVDDGYYENVQEHAPKNMQHEEGNVEHGSTEDNPDYYEDEEGDEDGYGGYIEEGEDEYDDEIEEEEEVEEGGEEDGDEEPDMEESHTGDDEEVDDFGDEDEQDYDSEDDDDSLPRQEASGTPEVITIDSDSD